MTAAVLISLCLGILTKTLRETERNLALTTRAMTYHGRSKFPPMVLVIPVILGFSHQTRAMEKMDVISESFPEFTTISKAVLLPLINDTFTDAVRLGKAQAHNVLSWAYLSYTNQQMTTKDFTTAQFDPAPQKFTTTLNQLLPSSFPFKATVFACDQLGEHELLDILAKKIDTGLPIMAYFIDLQRMSITTIVGYTKQEPPKLLVLRASGSERERLMAIDLHMFLQMMDMGEIFFQLSMKPPTTEAEQAKLRPWLDNRDTWKPFTLITFEAVQTHAEETRSAGNLSKHGDNDEEDAQFSICLLQ